jgi:hypothetical protein
VTAAAQPAAQRDRRILDTLARYFDIPADAAQPLLEQVETRRLAGGDWLMRQGDPGNSLYFLVQGRLQAWAADRRQPQGPFPERDRARRQRRRVEPADGRAAHGGHPGHSRQPADPHRPRGLRAAHAGVSLAGAAPGRQRRRPAAKQRPLAARRPAT